MSPHTIMNKYFSDERDYKQQIINDANSLPIPIKTKLEHSVLVWGAEVKLLDAGINGGDGGVDLFTVDEVGVVWLIEAKCGFNPQLGPAIWRDQIERYQEGVKKTSLKRLIGLNKSFLQGKRVMKPKDLSLGHNTSALVEVLSRWQAKLGRSLLPPEQLINRIAKTLKDGTYGIAITADQKKEGVIIAGKNFVHKGPLAYIQCIPLNRKLLSAACWIRDPSGTSNILPDNSNCDSRFDAYLALKQA